MSTCNCDGSVSGVNQVLPDSAYHVAGTTSPTQDAQTACATAIAEMKASGFDPCDSDYDALLQSFFSDALSQTSTVVSTEPNQNAIQGAFDQAIGTSAPGTPVVTNKAPAPTQNWTFIIGAALLLIVGLVLLLR